MTAPWPSSQRVSSVGPASTRTLSALCSRAVARWRPSSPFPPVIRMSKWVVDLPSSPVGHRSGDGPGRGGVRLRSDLFCCLGGGWNTRRLLAFALLIPIGGAPHALGKVHPRCIAQLPPGLVNRMPVVRAEQGYTVPRHQGVALRASKHRQAFGDIGGGVEPVPRAISSRNCRWVRGWSLPML